MPEQPDQPDQPEQPQMPQMPAQFFRREDMSSDRFFYEVPRFVTHIDDATIQALTEFYREVVPPGARVLDLMSSWVSHLPSDVEYARVAGLGMNQEELRDNPQLTDRVVHDLNTDPVLPYEAASFDVALCAVSVQYLVQPVDVFREVGRVLAPGGTFVVTFSHRMFPTKAVEVWRQLGPADRVRLVASYFGLAGNFDEPVFVDRSPPDADPLWCVVAQRSE
ncbi:MAG: class I SAM-dependent methyltransferase [Dehalococcoidia bacterium]|nr:class I SAM-dependent methyltransferase [Dehalococcoidia bacterium]